MDVLSVVGAIAGLVALGVGAFLAHLVIRMENMLLRMEAKLTASVAALRTEAQQMIDKEKERREDAEDRLIDKINKTYVSAREAFLTDKVHVEESALLKKIQDNHHARINTMERQIAELIYSRNPPKP